MKKTILLIFFLTLGFFGGTNICWAGDKDRPGSKDHPILTRMPNFFIDDYKEKEFDQYNFKGKQGEKLTVEGRKVYIDYGVKSGEKIPSELQIIRNHTNAIKQIGGTILHEDGYNAYMKVEKEGKETWIHVRAYNQGKAYSLNIIEKKAMVQEVFADAKAMADDLSSKGHTAIYGIYFDFDKADVKLESEPTLKEIAKLLSQDQKLKLYVIGHTDNVGGFDYNIRLSQSRANAVVKELISKYKVDGARLKPYGVGLVAPVASNKTEEGRAKNRRVELVER